MAQNQQSTAVAKVGETRLPYHAAFEQYYGILPAHWRVLTEMIFPSAKTPEAVLMAKSYCDALGLDIMRKPVHVVPIWDSEKKREVETVWLGIDYLRTIAHRTNSYAGKDETAWGDDETRHFTVQDKQGKTVEEFDLTFPAWAQITCYRIVQGQRVAFPGPRVRWIETYAARKGGAPNSMWRKRPGGQLEKCAEAAALRTAFPEEVGDNFSAEEGPGIYQRAPTSHQVQRAIVVEGTPERPDRTSEGAQVQTQQTQAPAQQTQETTPEQQQAEDYGLTLVNHKGEEVLAGADPETFQKRLGHAVDQYIERKAFAALDKLWQLNELAIKAVAAASDAHALDMDELEAKIAKAKEQESAPA